MSVAGEGPCRLGGGSGGQPCLVGTRLSGCCGVVVLVPAALGRPGRMPLARHRPGPGAQRPRDVVCAPPVWHARSVDAATVLPGSSPRTFMSPWEAAADIAGLWVRAPVLACVYLGGMLDPMLRERVMVAVSRVNACAGCTTVHERWALRAGVSTAELEAIGLGDLARLDDRSRAAVVYATALAGNRFRGAPDRELIALARRHLTAAELRAVEAVARLMAAANLSASSLVRASRARRRDTGP